MYSDLTPRPGDLKWNLIAKLLERLGGTPYPLDSENDLFRKMLAAANAAAGGGGGGSGTITSVNGDVGPAVSLDSGDIPEGANLYFTNARAIGATLTGFAASSGTVTAADTVLQALQRLEGRVAANDAAVAGLDNFADGAGDTNAEIYGISGTRLLASFDGTSGSFDLIYGDTIRRTVSNSYLVLQAGVAYYNGAHIWMYGDSHVANPGDLALVFKHTGDFTVSHAPTGSPFPTTKLSVNQKGQTEIFGTGLGAADSTPLLKLSQLWNSAPDTFSGIELLITNTASLQSSLMYLASDFGAGVVSYLRFWDTGTLSIQTVANNQSLSAYGSLTGANNDSTLYAESNWNTTATDAALIYGQVAYNSGLSTPNDSNLLFLLDTQDVAPAAAVTKFSVGFDGDTYLAGQLQVGARMYGPVVALVDGANIATNAALGNRFRVTLGGNRQLDNPTNAVDGQTLVWEIIQDGAGSRTLSLDTKFAFGSDITSITLTTTASKRDFLTAYYNSTADKFYVVSFVKGY